MEKSSDNEKVDMISIIIGAIALLIFYLFVCFLSWLALKVAIEWNYVMESPDRTYLAIKDPGGILVSIYSTINLPRLWYLDQLNIHTFTTLIVTSIIGLIIWLIYDSEVNKI